MNTSIGIGLPFNCNIVAFRESGEWYVFSYNGPTLIEKGAAPARVVNSRQIFLGMRLSRNLLRP
jgi:hypothetical protein